MLFSCDCYGQKALHPAFPLRLACPTKMATYKEIPFTSAKELLNILLVFFIFPGGCKSKIYGCPI